MTAGIHANVPQTRTGSLAAIFSPPSTQNPIGKRQIPSCPSANALNPNGAQRGTPTTHRSSSRNSAKHAELASALRKPTAPFHASSFVGASRRSVSHRTTWRKEGHESNASHKKALTTRTSSELPSQCHQLTYYCRWQGGVVQPNESTSYLEYRIRTCCVLFFHPLKDSENSGDSATRKLSLPQH